MKMLKNQLMADRSYHILADRPEDRFLPSVILRQPLRAWKRLDQVLHFGGKLLRDHALDVTHAAHLGVRG